MKLPRRQFLHLAAGAAALPAVSRFAWAQTYPGRPVRVIVPYAPGGPTDVFGRLIAQKLSEHFGKQFYVENVGGAGGNIGMGQGARAAPDGYTIVIVPPTIVINPSLYDKVPFDPYKDFDPVTLAVTSPDVLSVNPSLPVKTASELVASSKPVRASTALLHREPGRRDISLVNYSACRSASTSYMYRSTAQDWRSARQLRAIRRLPPPRCRQSCRR